MRRIATTLSAALGQSAAMAQQKPWSMWPAIPDVTKTPGGSPADLASLTPAVASRSCFSVMPSPRSLQSTSNAGPHERVHRHQGPRREFMSQPPIDTSKTLARRWHKVAVALPAARWHSQAFHRTRRCPRQSALAAHQQLYQSGRPRSGFVHNCLQMLSMSNSQTSGKLADHNAWVLPATSVAQRSSRPNWPLQRRRRGGAGSTTERQQSRSYAGRAAGPAGTGRAARVQQAIASAGQSQGSSGQSTSNDDDDDYHGGAHTSLAARPGCRVRRPPQPAQTTGWPTGVAAVAAVDVAVVAAAESATPPTTTSLHTLNALTRRRAHTRARLSFGQYINTHCRTFRRWVAGPEGAALPCTSSPSRPAHTACRHPHAAHSGFALPSAPMAKRASREPSPRRHHHGPAPTGDHAACRRDAHRLQHPPRGPRRPAPHARPALRVRLHRRVPRLEDHRWRGGAAHLPACASKTVLLVPASRSSPRP